MKKLKYFVQFLIISLLFFIFKLIGLKYSSILSGQLFQLLGPLFRSNKICFSNLSLAFPKLDANEKKEIIKKMWNNYGKILAEYIFIKNFRLSKNFSDKIIIENQNLLDLIKKKF